MKERERNSKPGGVREPAKFDSFNPLQVFNKPATLKILGLSDRTWDRLEARGETPPKTRLSENRIGYRASDLKDWLDRRREAETEQHAT